MMNDSARHKHIFVLTGPVQGGKTTLVSEKTSLLREKGVKVMGFLCPGSFSEGLRSAFSLVDLETGRRVPMGDTKKQKGWVKFRRFFFNPEAFVQGELWIKRCLKRDPDLLVIDEVGPMELEGKGWAPTLDTLAQNSSITQLWIVRQQILNEVSEKWKIPEDQIFTAETFENLSHKWMP
jgi:nucleoside-triphosphatase THEP1